MWKSSTWILRSERLYLLPGNSPVGLRLPLETLVWEPAEAQQKVQPVDPTSVIGKLPVPVRQFQGGEQPVSGPAVEPGSGAAPHSNKQVIDGNTLKQEPEPEPDSVVRTALVVEPRDGRLWVFIPPLESAEDYIDLLAAVEDTAAKLQMPVLIEGYPPPHDPRLRHIKLTPDPGVLEVNIHPAASWRELGGQHHYPL